MLMSPLQSLSLVLCGMTCKFYHTKNVLPSPTVPVTDERLVMLSWLKALSLIAIWTFCCFAEPFFFLIKQNCTLLLLFVFFDLPWIVNTQWTSNLVHLTMHSWDELVVQYSRGVVWPASIVSPHFQVYDDWLWYPLIATQVKSDRPAETYPPDQTRKGSFKNKKLS